MADKLTETVEPDALSSALEKIRAARDSRAVVALRGDEAKAVYEAAERADELQRSFELRWKADMRAIERWRAAKPGNDLVMPDHADLVVWLIEALTPAGEDEVERRERGEDLAQTILGVLDTKATLEQYAALVAMVSRPNVDEMREALESIAHSKFGLQGIQEEYGHDTNAYNFHAMKYWAKLALSYQHKALAALNGSGNHG